MVFWPEARTPLLSDTPPPRFKPVGGICALCFQAFFGLQTSFRFKTFFSFQTFDLSYSLLVAVWGVGPSIFISRSSGFLGVLSFGFLFEVF